MISILILIPVLCAAIAFFMKNNRSRISTLVFASVVHAAFVFVFWRELPSPEINGFIALDPIGLILISIISLLFLSVSVYMLGYFQQEQKSNRIFVTCILFLLSAMTLVSVSYHMGLMWVAIATTTLFSAPLISFHRNQQTLEATWKYLLVCSVGIAMALMGTFFLAIAADEMKTLFLPSLLTGAASLSLNWLKLGVIFLLVGYGCKMGLAPMHSWKPVAYGQASGMAAVLMAGGATQCAFLGLIRVSQICSRSGLTEFYSSILILTGLLSLIVPAVFILGERNIKRVLAYSSVEHMGILVLGLGFGGIGIFGALFHMINNSLAKVIMFLTAGSIAQKYGSSRVDDIRGIIYVYPVTGMLLLAGLFAGTGMFPFATFHSELVVLYSAVVSKHYLATGISVVCLAVIFIGIARVIFDVVLAGSRTPAVPGKENFMMNLAVIAAVVALLGLGVWMPSPLNKVLHDAANLIAARG